MGRPERSVDVESGPVARLACDLRALRQAAGTPSYRTLTARANYSATVLSRAASGRELPSLPVLLAYVTACGGDRDEWAARWQEVAGQLDGGMGARRAADPRGANPAELGAKSSVPDAVRSRPAVVTSVIRNRHLALALVLTLAAASGWATALADLANRGGSDPTTRPSAGSVAADTKRAATVPPANVGDGSDPAQSECSTDGMTTAHAMARLATAATIAGILRPAGTVVGFVELRYSPRCHAAWARATPADGYNVPSLGSITVTITRPVDETYSSFHVGLMQVSWGDMLMSSGGCLTAAAEFRFAAGVRAAARTLCWAGK